MQGTVIAINRDKSYCDVYVHGTASTYRAPLNDFASDEKLVIGADCEFEDISKPSMFSFGKAEIKSLKSISLGNDKVAATPETSYPLVIGADCEFEDISKPSMFSFGKAEIKSLKSISLGNDKVAATPETSYPEHKLMADNRKFLIAAEGGHERECHAALLEKAIECKANALLDLKLEVVVRPGVKQHLFRYTARPAIIDGPKYKQEPGIGLAIPEKVARRNSPNEAMVRYCRVLLICSLFIIIPSIMSLTARGVIPSQMMGQVITAGLIVLTMVLFMFMGFKKRQGFILTLKGIHDN